MLLLVVLRGWVSLQLVRTAGVDFPVDVSVWTDCSKHEIVIILELLFLNALSSACLAGPGCMPPLADHFLTVEIAFECTGQVGKLAAHVYRVPEVLGREEAIWMAFWIPPEVVLVGVGSDVAVVVETEVGLVVGDL